MSVRAPAAAPVDCAVEPLHCNGDYLSFPSRFADRSRPVADCEGLQRSILDLWDRPDSPRPEVEMGAKVDLSDAIVDALNIRFLLDGLAQPPAVSTEDLAGGPGYRQQRLRFADPHVGTFGALLLLPESGEGPFPAVLAMPGHNESPEVHRDLRHGALLAQRGHATLILAVRAYDSWEAEHEATVQLLCQGFSLQGLRVYETLVALRHLAADPRVDPRRIGLLGHSGGSATLNLVSRLGTPARALVTDSTTGYLNVHEGSGQRYISRRDAPRAGGAVPADQRLRDRRHGGAAGALRRAQGARAHPGVLRQDPRAPPPP